MDNPASKKYIHFDESLVEQNPQLYGRDLQEFVYDRAKDVQTDAMKRILGRFFQRVMKENKDTQTFNKDKILIQELSREMELL